MKKKNCRDTVDGSGDKKEHWLQEKPLGQALRDQYNEVVNEPLPDRFQEMLKKMRDKETKR